jgi:hypothetical protein
MNRLPRLCASAALGIVVPAWAQQPVATLTLGEAVQQVQQQTGGTVLSAEPRQYGRKVEYQVKVLMPNGHVRVVPVSSEAGKAQAPVQTIKNPAGDGRSNKEKH